MSTSYHAIIIDDDSHNVSVLARLLEQQNVSHTAVTHPQNLNEVLETVPHFDVIFLDLELPGVDGYEILQQFNAQEKTSQVPIVAYTVHTSEMHVAHEKGFHSFLAKPVDPERFPSQLERILNNARVWESI